MIVKGYSNSFGPFLLAYDNENEMPDFVILVDSLHRTKDTAGCTYITFFYVKHVGFLKCKILSGSDD